MHTNVITTALIFIGYQQQPGTPCFNICCFQECISFCAAKRHKVSVHVMSTAPEGADNMEARKEGEAGSEDQSDPAADDVELVLKPVRICISQLGCVLC